jgi:hypothetical protein
VNIDISKKSAQTFFFIEKDNFCVRNELNWFVFLLLLLLLFVSFQKKELVSKFEHIIVQ